jgi:hypothetical protein
MDCAVGSCAGARGYGCETDALGVHADALVNGRRVMYVPVNGDNRGDPVTAHDDHGEHHG